MFKGKNIQIKFLKHKSIKKTAKILAILILIITGIIITVWTAMRSPAIQTVAAKKLFKNLSKEIGTNISVSRIRYGLNQNLIIKDLYIEDEQKDTLLYIRRLSVMINDIDLNNKKMSFGKIIAKDLYNNIYQIDDSNFNFTYIINKLKTDKTEKFNWLIRCKKFSVANSSINFNNLKENNHYLSKISLKLSDIYIDSSEQKLTITNFETDINKKPFLNNFSVLINKKHNNIKIHDLNVLMPNSHLNMEFAIINLHDNHNQKNADYEPFTYHANISSLKIILRDLKAFIPKFYNSNDVIRLSGTVSGSKNKIKGKSIKLNTGQESRLLCDFNILNLQNPKNISYSFKIQSLFTNKSDIAYITNNYFDFDTTAIPNQLSILGDILYKGIINGNYYNLYNNGQVLSRLGQIDIDISLKKDNNDVIWLEGNTKATPLYLDMLFDNSEIGEIGFDINANGFFSKTDGPDFEITGNIDHFNYSKYSVDSIDISGHINKDQFIGRISSYDPNLRFDFDGALNFDTLPSYDFLLNLYYANLYNIGVNINDTSANLSLVIKVDFVGNSIDNTTGEIQILDIFYINDTSYFATDSILIISKPIKDGKELKFYSEYLQANINGNYNSLTLIRSFKTLINHYLPSLGIAPNKPDYKNNFSFEITADYPHPLTNLIAPGLKISPGSNIKGKFNGKEQIINLSLKSDQIKYYDKKISDINLKAFTKNDKISVNITTNEFKYNKKYSLKNFYISTNIYNDSIYANFNWNNWLDLNYSGNINTIFSLSPGKIKTIPNLKLDILPSNINILDTLWFLSQGYIKKDSTGYTIHNIKIDNGISKLNVSGIVSDNPEDSIEIYMKKFNIEQLNNLIKNDLLVFGGKLTGSTLIKDIKGEKKINSNFEIENLMLNGKLVGNTKLVTKWNEEEKSLYVSSSSLNDNIETFSFNGYISPGRGLIDIDVYFNQQSLTMLEPFIRPVLADVSGKVYGEVKIYGNLKNPSWKGSLMASDAKLLVTPTNVYYKINDSIRFSDHDIIFKNIIAFDDDNNYGLINGRIWHEHFSNSNFDLRIETDKILAIDIKSKDSPYYYGKIYGSGYVEINGPNSIIDINIAAKTEKYSFIHIPLEGKGDIEDNDFIEFVNPYSSIIHTKTSKKEQKILPKNKTITNIRIDLDVTPDAEVQIIFDPRIGDVLRANGYAHLTIESLGPNFNMYGIYTITKGDFMFTLQNVINKRLNIQQGSTVSFSGHPLDANIDMDAVYKVRKALVYDLTLDEADKEKRVEVNTHLLMTGKLVNPNIKFSIDVPSATNDEDIDQLNSLPEEELNKQVLSLLLVNKFTTLTNYQSGFTGNTTTKLGATTASELLSNQLSNWMSQISNDFDLGFVYRPGDENTQQEYEVAFSTNLLNDRIILNGNVGYSENQRQVANTPYTTDFQIEYKINKKGNIRLRAFQKMNNDITYNQAPYTQGIGIFYTEGFNNFNELLQKMFRRESATKPKEVTIELENSNISN